MKKLLFLLLPITLISCTLKGPGDLGDINFCPSGHSVFLYQTNCDGSPVEYSISEEELHRLREIETNSTELCIPVTINQLNNAEQLEGFIKSSDVLNICSI